MIRFQTRVALSALLAAAAAPMFLASSAQARTPLQTCETDAECGKGYACEVVWGGGCDAPACAEGQDCPPPPDCRVEEVRACVPGAACQTSADCGEGMVCFESREERCTVPPTPPCSAGSDCADTAPEERVACEERTENVCIPRWAAPCSADADCGDGFRCVEQQSCGCSGSGSSGSPPERDPSGSSLLAEDCSCEPSGEFRCEPRVERCGENSDCPADWECADVGDTGAVCTDTPSADGAEPVCEEPPTPSPEDLRCVPPYGGVGRDGGWGYSDGDLATGAPESSAGDSSSDEGGCRIAALPSAHGTGVLGGVMLAGLALLRVRRRPAARGRQ